MKNFNIDYCTKCGKCKEVCPSYKLFLNESYSPRGRLKLISEFNNRKITESNSFKRRLFSCFLCGACLVCPVEISIPMSVYETRASISKAFKLYFLKYFSFYPEFFFTALNLVSPLFRLFKTDYQIRKFSSFIVQKEKNLLKIYSKPLAKGRFALFFGCTTNYLLPSLKQSLISILNNIGYEVLVPKQNCCAAPLYSAGFKEEALKLSEENIKSYNSFNIDGVITPCPTCAYMIDKVYKQFLGESIKVIRLSEVLENFSGTETSKEAIFHISCHMKNYIKDDARISEILKNSGLKIQTDEGCCGFAGLFSFLFEKESLDILNRKVLKYKNVDMIITSCPNCLLQFKFALGEDKVFHYVEVLNKNLNKGVKNG